MKLSNSLSRYVFLAMIPLIISAFTIPTSSPTPSASKPDLMVRAINFPDGYKLGNCTDVKVAIGNLSEVAAGKFKVELYLSENNQPLTKLYRGVKGLGPKKTTWVTFKDVKVKTKETAKLQITADISKMVPESNEYNNKKLIYPKPKAACKGGLTSLP